MCESIKSISNPLLWGLAPYQFQWRSRGHRDQKDTGEEDSGFHRESIREMASATITSPLAVRPSAVRGLPSLARPSSSLKVQASGVKKKIKTNTPYGPGGGMSLPDGLDASGRKAKGKGVYQFANKYGANVDGYSPIYSPEEWSKGGDVYVGGTTGLFIWAVTLGALLLGGALLVYNTSALSG